jgi:hypothetical protein
METLNMNHPYFLIAGVTILGFLAPELAVAIFRVKVPGMFNFLFGVGCGLIAYSFLG